MPEADARRLGQMEPSAASPTTPKRGWWATFTRDHPHRFDAGLAVLIFLATIAAVVITLCALTIGTVRDAEYWSHPRPVAVAALCALSIALADAVRNRRAYVAAVEERARRAEESRAQEASRRVSDER